MDPDAAAAVMRDFDADPEDRIAAAQNLIAWIEGGGFPQQVQGFSQHPCGSVPPVARQIALRECETMLMALNHA